MIRYIQLICVMSLLLALRLRHICCRAHRSFDGTCLQEVDIIIGRWNNLAQLFIAFVSIIRCCTCWIFCFRLFNFVLFLVAWNLGWDLGTKLMAWHLAHYLWLEPIPKAHSMQRIIVFGVFIVLDFWAADYFLLIQNVWCLWLWCDTICLAPVQVRSLLFWDATV